MPNFEPLPGVSYRIQNVDFATYLEFRTVGQTIQAVTRPWKNTLSQEWLFVKSSSGGLYSIQNAAPGPNRRYNYLSANDQQVFGTTKSGSAKSWSIEETTDSDRNYLLSYPVGDNDTYIYLSDDGQPHLISSENKTSSENESNNFRWHILEVEPALPRTFLLPKGTYRVRSLANLFIRISPSSDIVSTQNQRQNAHQAWEVQPTGNGNCIVKAYTENSYLGWVADSHGLPSVRKTSTPKVWQLSSLGGGYIYLITMKYAVEGATLTLALGLQDNGEVLLTPRNYTYNQIWFFEGVDGAKLPTAGGDRYPEMPEAQYFIRNCGSDKNYIGLDGSPAHRVIPKQERHFWWAIKYEDAESARFTISLTPSVGSLSIANNYLVAGSTAEKWILERSETDSERYFICSASNTDKVLSGLLTKDVERFRLEDRQKESERQLWTFIEYIRT